VSTISAQDPVSRSAAAMAASAGCSGSGSAACSSMRRPYLPQSANFIELNQPDR